jgi:hypothetical protein
MRRKAASYCTVVLPLLMNACTSSPPKMGQGSLASWDPFLDTVESRTVRFFLESSDRSTGLVPDRFPSESPCSVAAVGFALTCYPIAVERGIIGRHEAALRVQTTLRTLVSLPQGEASAGTGGYRGFFYHFLSVRDGTRVWQCELSTIDTALLMAGVLCCGEFFDGESSVEQTIRALADSLYRRVDWRWAMGESAGIRLGWKPEEGFNQSTWQGYNEAMLLYLLALGSPEHPVPSTAWEHWTATYRCAEYYGREYVSFGPLFGHQYSHCWVDFRGIQDAYMHLRGFDYFENSRRATAAQQAYGMANPSGWNGYTVDQWCEENSFRLRSSRSLL